MVIKLSHLLVNGVGLSFTLDNPVPVDGDRTVQNVLDGVLIEGGSRIQVFTDVGTKQGLTQSESNPDSYSIFFPAPSDYRPQACNSLSVTFDHL